PAVELCRHEPDEFHRRLRAKVPVETDDRRRSIGGELLLAERHVEARRKPRQLFRHPDAHPSTLLERRPVQLVMLRPDSETAALDDQSAVSPANARPAGLPPTAAAICRRERMHEGRWPEDRRRARISE